MHLTYITITSVYYYYSSNIANHLYQELLRRLESYLKENNTSFVAANVKLLITLWTLGNQDSFRAIRDRFGMMKGTARVVNVERRNNKSTDINLQLSNILV